MAKLFLIWAGLVLGVSFLATPAKFLAPDLDLPTALQVGRETFRIFSYVEAFLVIASLGIAYKQYGYCWRIFMWPYALAVLLSLQYFFILPLVAQYSDAVIAGDAVSGASSLHQVYVGLELVKLALLLWLGIKNPFPARR